MFTDAIATKFSHSIFSGRYLVAVCLAAFSLSFLPQAFASDQATSRGEFLGAMSTTYPDWFKESFLELNDDVSEAAGSNKRVMLVFHQDGCPYCNAFVEKNLAQRDIEDKLKAEYDVIAINMWGDLDVAHIDGKTYTEKSFAAALKVQYTPTVLFLDEAGKLALRLNGYYGPERFRHALDFVSAKSEKDETFAAYLESKGAKKEAGALAPRGYFVSPGKDLAARPGKDAKPYAIFFEQSDCASCTALHDKILALPESKALLEKFDLYQIDMWSNASIVGPAGESTSGRELARTLNVSYAPTVVLYANDGTEVIRSEAIFKRFHTQSIFDYVSSNAWKTQPSFQRYISERAEHMQDAGKDVNIWN